MRIVVCARDERTPVLQCLLDAGYEVTLTTPDRVPETCARVLPTLTVTHLPAARDTRCPVDLSRLPEHRPYMLAVARDEEHAAHLLAGGYDDIVLEGLLPQALLVRARLACGWDRAERTLAAERALLQALQRAGQIGMVLLDEEGRVLLSNDGMSRIFGYTADELAALPVIEEIVAPAERPLIRRARERLVADFDRTAGSVFNWLTRDGSYVTVEIAATAVERDAGRRGLLVEAREVSEEVQLLNAAEADAGHRRRERAAGALLSELAVELERLRPLVAGDALRPLAAEHRRVVVEAVERGAEVVELVRPLLDTPSVDVPVDPARVAYRAFALLREVADPRVEFDVQIRGTPPLLWVDRPPLERAVSHLFLLAREAVSAQLAEPARRAEDARIELVVEPAEAPSDAPFPGSPHVLISVRHSGERRDESAEAAETSLRRLVASLDGVFHRDRDGGLVRLAVLLPARQPPGAAPALDAAEEHPGEPSVLLVDDEIEVHEIASTALASAGVAVTGVTTAEAAFRVLDERRIDLVLLAIDLPEVSGWQVLKRLRERSPQLPVLMLGRFATPEDAQRAGARGLLADPLNVRALRRAVAEVVAVEAAPAG